MKPLILAATAFEIQQSIPVLKEKGIPYLISGVGMTATAFALGKYLAVHKDITPMVINVGIAGSLNKDIPLGSVLSIQSDCFSELGAQSDEDFISIDELGFGCSTYYACKDAELNIDLPMVDAITVNRVHGKQSSIDKLRSRFPHLSLESMEGAAAFYACAQENIPCLQVRSVSNYVEKRDKSTWKIQLALNNLNQWLMDYLQQKY